MTIRKSDLCNLIGVQVKSEYLAGDVKNEHMDIYRILSYGSIGLGCILAICAYFLLKKEQSINIPRKSILTAIYCFMLFSLILTSIGFFNEYRKNADVAEINRLKENNAAELNKLKEGNASRLKSIQEILHVLLKQKTGKINKLSELLNTRSPHNRELLNEITKDLHSIDSSINVSLSDSLN